MRVLIVEDERPIADLIRLTLSRAGYTCVCAFDGVSAADLVAESGWDLVLLDVMLPGLDGHSLLPYIAGEGIPVIFVTARGTLEDRVQGLQMGADDYIVKPFEPPELVARVGAVLRRAGKGSAVMKAFDVELDAVARQVRQNGKPITLTPLEFDLLEILLRNRGIAMYRNLLYEQVWGAELAEGNRTLDLHILRLRQKLSWQWQIRTVHRIGYMVEKEE